MKGTLVEFPIRSAYTESVFQNNNCCSQEHRACSQAWNCSNEPYPALRSVDTSEVAVRPPASRVECIENTISLYLMLNPQLRVCGSRDVSTPEERGIRGVGPEACKRLTVKSTLFCSAAVSPSHDSPNLPENSTFMPSTALKCSGARPESGNKPYSVMA
jgi:hypothetical protein